MKRITLFILFITFSSNAQDPLRFKEEVAQIQNKYKSNGDSSRETVVFTGSSSIRFWNNLQNVFHDHQIVNTGFGGSHASDLLAYIDELVLQYEPDRVFIYEGDNDISFKKRPRQIRLVMQEIIDKIRAQYSDAKIILISAKPSMARWHLRRKYRKLNRKFKRLAKHDSSLEYANIWDIMLSGRKVREDIFVEDGLHMNQKGYELWYSVIKQYMN